MRTFENPDKTFKAGALCTMMPSEAETSLESISTKLDAERLRAWIEASRSRIGNLVSRPIHLIPPPTAAEAVIHLGFHQTPFGGCLLATIEQSVCQLDFLDHLDRKPSALEVLQCRWPGARLLEDPGTTGPILTRIFDSNLESSGQPLDLMPKGTSFQIKVWEALLRIPHGCLTTYKDLAHQIGSPNASRALGGAVGANPIAYLIPCHRVIQSNGAIGGYRWGLERKRAMLAGEAMIPRSPLQPSQP